jgi:hypothetical protein
MFGNNGNKTELHSGNIHEQKILGNAGYHAIQNLLSSI